MRLSSVKATMNITAPIMLMTTGATAATVSVQMIRRLTQLIVRIVKYGVLTVPMSFRDLKIFFCPQSFGGAGNAKNVSENLLVPSDL